MNPLQADAERHFEATLGAGLDALLAPIADDAPCGRPARHCASHHALQEARRQDDPSLPLGAWQHDLKRADWGETGRLVSRALRYESKDLQLLAWLQEAQIRQHGIAGIAPTLVLARELCLRHWDNLHPQASDGDFEHRANILSSMATRNLPAIRLAPLIGIDGDQPYSWADWEHAQLKEQVRAGHGNAQREAEGASLQELQGAMNSAATDGFLALHAQLEASLQAIAELSAAIDPLFGEHAPGMGGMTQLLQQMCALVDGELHRRGVRLDPEPEVEIEEASRPVPAAYAADETRAPAAAHGAIRDRADAYARLAETAEFLMRLEPHSPVPYLVRRATEWGSLNTVELYQELFLRLNGQLNIFEILGLESARQHQQAQ